WIWLGCIVLIFGSVVCMWPELAPAESRAWAFARSGAAVAASLTFGLLIAATPSSAFAQGTSSLRSGTVKSEKPIEKELFGALEGSATAVRRRGRGRSAPGRTAPGRVRRAPRRGAQRPR